MEAQVKIENVMDPDTQTDVSPVKSGMVFVQHFIFALEKAMQTATLQQIKDDSDLTAGWWGNVSRTQKGQQTLRFTDHGSVIIDGTDTMVTLDIYVSLHAKMAEYMGIVASGTVGRTNAEGKNIRHYDRGPDVQTGNFRAVETIYNTQTRRFTYYIELHNHVNWEIIGLNNGWFEQVFMANYRVVRIFSNICDSLVVGATRTNVLAEAKVDALMAEGQQYYEPVHLRYVPVRQRELDVIEITLDDLNGHIVDLGIGVTSAMLHFKRGGAIKSGHNC